MGRISLTLAVAMLCAGCAFSGPGYPYVKCGVGSPARHNVELRAGGGYRWDTGAQVEATYRPWLRVEDPSSRGFPEEIGRFMVEAEMPLGR